MMYAEIREKELQTTEGGNTNSREENVYSLYSFCEEKWRGERKEGSVGTWLRQNEDDSVLGAAEFMFEWAVFGTQLECCRPTGDVERVSKQVPGGRRWSQAGEVDSRKSVRKYCR